jgi:hypothetical protein
VGAAGRGRPPEAAARRAGLEDVEKLLTKLTSTDTAERNAGMLRVPLRRIFGRAGYRLELRVALVAIAKRRLGQLLDHLAAITGSGAGLVRGSGLGPTVGHASTVRPDPSTLARRENEAPTSRVARDPSRHAAPIEPTTGSG